MSIKSQQFKARTPALNLSEDLGILGEFSSEALNHLVSAQNSLLALETVPNNQEEIDNIFKVFHTIAGLAGFLSLDDIQVLSSEIQVLLDMVRKGLLPFEGDVAEAVLQTIDGLRQLLILLNEQIDNDGKLKSPYFDASGVIALIQDIAENKKITQAVKPKQQFREKLNLVAARLMVRYQQVGEGVKDKSGDVTINAEVLRSMIGDMNAAYEELQYMKDTLLQRQREIIREREFALHLSQRAQDTARMKGDFLASMAHEIRTLINTILGFSDLLIKSPLESKQKEHLKAVVTSGKLLLDVVNNILDFSKIEKGKLALENIDFRIDVLVQDVFRILKPRSEAKTVNLCFEMEQDVPLNLIGDPTKLKQILINLIDNAIKFTEKGEVALFIKSGELAPSATATSERTLRFTVKDTGMGIPDNKKDLIFESFTQADNTMARRFGGSGLGLAICKSYVEAMGGKIWVESQVGAGSKFIFTVKLKEGKIKATETMGVAAESAGEPQTDAQLEASCKGIKVLVVDDSVPNQELVKAYFDFLGCDGDFASNGQEAIEKIRTNPYDVCFMDLQMPFMGGLEATQIIRQNIKKTLPVIALTATAMGEKKGESQKAGITDFLEKPFDMVQLKEKILQHAKR